MALTSSTNHAFIHMSNNAKHRVTILISPLIYDDLSYLKSELGFNTSDSVKILIVSAARDLRENDGRGLARLISEKKGVQAPPEHLYPLVTNAH